MANISLKISNVHEYPQELIARLRGVQSPGKVKLITSLKNEDWESVYQELLYRIELYASAKVLNYTRQAIIDVTKAIFKVGVKRIASELYNKFVNSTSVNTEITQPASDQNTTGIDVFEYLIDQIENLDQPISTWVEKGKIDSVFQLKKGNSGYQFIYNGNEFYSCKDFNDQSFDKKCIQFIDKILSVKDFSQNAVLNEAEKKQTQYAKFFKDKLEEYGVKSPGELSDEDKKKFFSEVEKEWD
jgi:hypothetical protein